MPGKDNRVQITMTCQKCGEEIDRCPSCGHPTKLVLTWARIKGLYKKFRKSRQ